MTPSQKAQCAIAASVLMFASIAATAGDWSFVPHISLSEQYTDNVTLVDRDTLDDYITSVNTGISVRGTSSRLDSNVDYNLQYQNYADNDNFDGTNHQLQGATHLTVIEHWLSFHTSSSVSQQAIDNSSRFGESNRSQTGNRTTVIYSDYGPSMNHRFGKWAIFNGSFTKSRSDTSGGDIGTNGGSGSDEVLSLSLSSGNVLSRTPLSISYSNSEEKFDSGRTNSQERINGSVAYIFNRMYRANFNIGNSKNSGRDAGNNGTTWSVGGTVTPSSRSEISGNYGKQVFGNSYNINARHRHRRWNFTARYTEDVTTRSQELRDLVLVPLTDGFGNPIFDPDAASNILNPDDLQSINEESSVRKQLGINANYQGRRMSGRVGFKNTKRTGQSSGGDETITVLNASINRTLSRRLSVGASTNFRQTKSSGTSGNDQQTFRFGPNARYTLGPHSDVNLSYSYSAGSGNTSGDSYLENSLSARVTVNF